MKYFSLIVLLLGSVLFAGCTLPHNSTTDTQPTIEEVLGIIEVVEEEKTAVPELLNISIEASGAEPFWHFVASGTNLVWTEPSMAGPINSNSYNVALTQSGTDVLINGTGFSAILTLGSCSDGMSGLPFAYVAVISKGAQTFNGCANVTS